MIARGGSLFLFFFVWLPAFLVLIVVGGACGILYLVCIVPGTWYVAVVACGSGVLVWRWHMGYSGTPGMWCSSCLPGTWYLVGGGGMRFRYVVAACGGGVTGATIVPENRDVFVEVLLIVYGRGLCQVQSGPCVGGGLCAGSGIPHRWCF